MNHKNIIIFSSIDWSTHRQLHHELVDYLLKNNNKILFIENVGSRSIKIIDFFRIKKRLQVWFNGHKGYQNIDNKLTIYTPIFLPFNFSKIFVSLNSLILSNSIIKWLKITYFDAPVVISFLPTPLVQSIINKINPLLKVYYCADLMHKSMYSSKKIKPWEVKFIKNVDHIFYTSKSIGNNIRQHNNNSTYITNGVNFNKFTNLKPDRLNKFIELKNKPIVGYIGAIRSILDYNLLEFLLKNLDYNFLFVGPILDNKYKKLLKHKNFYLIGHQDHNLIPDFINLFDICIIPYIKNEFTNAIYPVKLNEYLALGKRVISTDIYELIEFDILYKNIIILCSTKEQFLKEINVNILNKVISKAEKEKAINIAKINSWENKFNEVFAIINNKLNQKSIPHLLDWEIYTKKYKYNLFKSFSKFIGIISIIYFLIFVSPLYWFLGEKLIVNDVVSNHDTAFILSGTKDLNFLAKKYQNRVYAAINLFKKNKINFIYISSGYTQNLFGIEFINNLLISRGIPKKNFFIETKFSNTTYLSLKNIFTFSKKNQFDNILILTDFYHSRRVKLIMDSKFNTIDSSILVDIKNSNKKWNIGFDNIGDINYELLAILYNIFKNRI